MVAPQHRMLLLLLLALLHLLDAVATSNQQTYGIYGAIQSLDKRSSTSWLLDQCYAGFTLNGCQDLNASDATAMPKDYSFATQFTDPAKITQQFCLQCCTKPAPLRGADETWNLSCPLNDLQRLSVSQDRRVFRFARRDTLADETVIECPMPARTPSTYLSGYALTLFIIERTASFGATYWRSVVNCSVSIAESASPPAKFNEVIRVLSIPTPQDRPTAWVTPTVLAAATVLVLLSVPIYKGHIRGQRCRHCGSWLVVVRELCAVCIVIGCSLRAPPAKVFAANGPPHDGGRSTTESSSS